MVDRAEGVWILAPSGKFCVWTEEKFYMNKYDYLASFHSRYPSHTHENMLGWGHQYLGPKEVALW